MNSARFKGWLRDLWSSLGKLTVGGTADLLIKIDSDGNAAPSTLTENKVLEDTDVLGTVDQITVTVSPTGTITISLPASIFLSGATAERILATDADSKTVSVDLIDWILETSNKVTVTDNLDGTVTLTLPDSIELTGATASKLLATDANKLTVSVAALSAWIAGTSNQVTVTDDGDGTLTLSLPQNIHTAATPTFAGLILGSGTLKQNSILQQYSGSKTLVDATPTGCVTIAIAQDTVIGGHIDYTIEVLDGTDLQIHAGSLSFAAANKAGTISTDIDEVYVAASRTIVATAGTLTDSWSITTGTDEITIVCDANTSLSPTSFIVKYSIRIKSLEVITPL